MRKMNGRETERYKTPTRIPTTQLLTTSITKMTNTENRKTHFYTLPKAHTTQQKIRPIVSA